MRRTKWRATWGLAIALIPGIGWTEEPQWHPVGAAPAAGASEDSSPGHPAKSIQPAATGVSLGRPLVAASPKLAEGQQAGPSLGRPIVGSGKIDSQVQPASARAAAAATPSFMVRAQSSDETGTTISETITGSDASSLICDDLCCPGAPAYCWWFRGEYLHYWIKDSTLPPLVTTSPPESLGVIGAPGTRVLFGGDIDHGSFSGGRATIGYWWDPCMECGLEGSFFMLGEQTVSFRRASGGIPLLARPFVNEETGDEDSELVANPPVPSIPGLLPLTGSVDIQLQTELIGADINTIWNICQDECVRWDFLLGARFLQLEEELRIREDLLVPATSPQFAGTRFLVNDFFAARNTFYGGQLGLRKEWRRGCWQVDMWGKVGLGATHQQVDIKGSTRTINPDGSFSVSPSGLLAQRREIGSHSATVFSVAPEAGINLGYYITDYLKVIVGYNFLYWTNVARAADQVDRRVSVAELENGNGSTSNRREFRIKDSDFWAHGLSVGLELRY